MGIVSQDTADLKIITITSMEKRMEKNFEHQTGNCIYLEVHGVIGYRFNIIECGCKFVLALVLYKKIVVLFGSTTSTTP